MKEYRIRMRFSLTEEDDLEIDGLKVVPATFNAAISMEFNVEGQDFETVKKKLESHFVSEVPPGGELTIKILSEGGQVLHDEKYTQKP